MMMLEQQKMSASGFLFTTGPSTYKIPGFGDIPLEFNVSLLKGSLNKRAVCSSKVRTKESLGFVILTFVYWIIQIYM